MYLDHVILAVPDLANDSRRLADALGLVVHPGGEHPGWGTHNAIVRFGQSYIELIAVNDEAAARKRPRGDRLLAALERGPGWLGYALGTDDLDSTAAEIRARGLAVRAPDAGRRLRPDGVELRWRSASIGDEAMWGGLLPFLIQHDTPLEVRAGPASASSHSLGAVGVSAVGIAVSDIAAGVPTYEALTGQAPTNDHVGFVQAQRANWRLDDGCLLRMLSPEHVATGPVAEHIAERGEGLFIVRLAVRDLEHAAAELARRGTPVSERQEDGTVFLLDPRRTLGARFALIERQV
jgi:Glyoxalase-like domain